MRSEREARDRISVAIVAFQLASRDQRLPVTEPTIDDALDAYREAVRQAYATEVAAKVKALRSSCGSRDSSGPCCVEADEVLALLATPPDTGTPGCLHHTVKHEPEMHANGITFTPHWFCAYCRTELTPLVSPSSAPPAGSGEPERQLFCVWCGAEVPWSDAWVGDEEDERRDGAIEAMRTHSATCPEHPAVKALAAHPGAAVREVTPEGLRQVKPHTPGWGPKNLLRDDVSVSWYVDAQGTRFAKHSEETARSQAAPMAHLGWRIVRVTTRVTEEDITTAALTPEGK